MRNSLFASGDGAEYYSLSDWLAFRDLDRSAQRVDSTFLKDPLFHAFFPGISPTAIFGYQSDGTNWNICYFWCKDLQRLKPSRMRDPKWAEMMCVGSLLSKGADQELTLGQMLQFDHRITESLSSAGVSADEHLYWISSGSYRFAALYSVQLENQKFCSESIGAFLGLHLDYYTLRSPASRHVPMDYCSTIAGSDSEALVRLFLHPKCFNPVLNADRTLFAWPWQKSICMNSGESSLGYDAVATTSLVFDIRKSTMVLEQLDEQRRGEFPTFINKVSRIAREKISKHGGFFDKETGDGVVAHFCRLGLGAESEPPPSLRAFQASREILTDIGDVCDSMQRNLSMGVGGLGGSIGLHSSKAVWSCDEGHISALGDSVIQAARLCGEADNFAIFVSNSEFERLQPHLSADMAARFNRQSFRGKEFSESAKLFGHSFKSRRR